MPINFTAIFQDSWNFMHNQRQFTLFFAFVFFAAMGIVSWLTPNIADVIPANAENLTDKELAKNLLNHIMSNNLFIYYLINQTVILFIANWGILHIHHISQRQNTSLLQSAVGTAAKFLGIIGILLISMLPLLLGLNIAETSLSAQKSPPITALVLLIIGLYVYIRLNLAVITYLIGERGFAYSLKYMWLLANNRMGSLSFFAIIVGFLLPIINKQIASFADNFVTAAIALVIIALINVFSMVLTYRFYSVFTQKA
ncbi:hypothetical protein RYD26_04800 [Pasteurellaceae bacterium LIM206]|nr:hypothetical protein [Pasteurellaceae bacterium LIM206]